MLRRRINNALLAVPRNSLTIREWIHFFLLCQIALTCIASCQSGENAKTNAEFDPFVYLGMNGRLFEVQRPNNEDFAATIVVYADRLGIDEEMCASVSIGEIGEVVGTLDDALIHFTSANNFGVRVDETSQSVYYTHPLAFQLSHGDEGITATVDYCFRTAAILEGQHLATLELTDMRGMLHLYTWEFEVSVPP